MSSGKYDDIINLPHHVSTTRPQMPIPNRAAQFIPFKALTGYDSAVDETARRTDTRIVLGEEAIAALDKKLTILADEAAQHPEATITYFLEDEKKAGGTYVTLAGAVKRVNDVERVILLETGQQIPIVDVLDIESNLFRDLV